MLSVINCLQGQVNLKTKSQININKSPSQTTELPDSRITSIRVMHRRVKFMCLSNCIWHVKLLLLLSRVRTSFDTRTPLKKKKFACECSACKQTTDVFGGSSSAWGGGKRINGLTCVFEGREGEGVVSQRPQEVGDVASVPEELVRRWHVGRVKGCG